MWFPMEPGFPRRVAHGAQCPGADVPGRAGVPWPRAGPLGARPGVPQDSGRCPSGFRAVSPGIQAVSPGIWADPPPSLGPVPPGLGPVPPPRPPRHFPGRALSVRRA